MSNRIGWPREAGSEETYRVADLELAAQKKYGDTSTVTYNLFTKQYWLHDSNTGRDTLIGNTPQEAKAHLESAYPYSRSE